MDIGGERYAAVGRVHAVPVADVEGTLILCGLDAVGPDPAGLLAAVEGDVVVCLQTDRELDRRFPDYRPWLSNPSPHEAIRLPTEDHMVSDDGAVLSLVADLHDRLGRGQRTVVHCGAGWGRAGVVAILVMVAAGADVETARRDLRAARPAAGPQSVDQDRQVMRLAAAVRAAALGHSSP
jgi:Swiss Army Knife protein, DSP-PTPase phosphatase domain